jgi:hypothetical protein
MELTNKCTAMEGKEEKEKGKKKKKRRGKDW